METEDSNYKAGVLRVRAPAKVNLSLRILGRLQNGFHLLSSVVCPLSLADEMEIRILENRAPRKITVRFGAALESHHAAVLEGDPEFRFVLNSLATESNLAYKAAALFFHTIGDEQPGFEIGIEKNIPLAAGLGGGSSDAAATLRALNELTNRRLSEKQLAVLGAELGADVPALLGGRLGFMTGIGEQFAPIAEVPELLRAPLHAVLVKPCAAVSTAWAYERLGFPADIAPGGVREFLSEKLQNEPHLQALGLRFQPGSEGDKWLTLLPQEGISDTLVSGSREKIYAHFVNDFQGLVCRQIPEIAQAEDFLRQSGAEHTLLAGSGSSLLGFYPSEQKREDGLRWLQDRGRSGWLITRIQLML